MYLIVLSILVTLMQENPEYSVFSLQTVGLYCILVGLFWKNWEILAKCWQIQSNFLKTWEIQGKMLNMVAKWLHYLWTFPNIRGILIKLSQFHGDFSENSGNSCQNAHINVTFFSIHNYINVIIIRCPF